MEIDVAMTAEVMLEGNLRKVRAASKARFESDGNFSFWQFTGEVVRLFS
jgi:hypothetical protein